MPNTQLSNLRRLAEIALLILPLLVASVLADYVRANAPAPDLVTTLVSVPAASASGLSATFTEAHYTWPPHPTVPALVPDRLPPDLADIGSTQRKRLFLQALLPAVIAENNRIRLQRRLLVRIFERGAPAADTAARAQLMQIAQRYRVEGDPADPVFQQRLLRRVDTVPFALVLAQGAKESGWGTSRFAQQANSLFGIWTYKPQAGVTPRDRAEDDNNFVRRFPDINAAVRSYLYNINVGHAYVKLRKMRAVMRAAGLVRLDPDILAGGLENYSELGAEYIDHIRSLMRQNGLDRMARPRLVRPGEFRGLVEDEPGMAVPVITSGGR